MSASTTLTALDGRRRVLIENVRPSVDGGRFAVKRIIGDWLSVDANAFTDGHDEIRLVLAWRAPGADPDETWNEQDMEPLGNDEWRSGFPLEQLGRYEFTVFGWIDRWRTWQHDLAKRVEAGQDVSIDLLIGKELVESAAGRAAGADTTLLRATASDFDLDKALDERLGEIVERYPDRSLETTLDMPLTVTVDPVLARFSAWYELFPRSASPDPARHGTFADVIDRLDYVAELGFDVLYLPPIHPDRPPVPQGPEQHSRRRSRPIRAVPWAIGGPEGGHKAIHPELGTLDDFRALVDAAATAASRSRSTSRSRLARPPVGERASRVVPARGPTARSSTPRIRRRSTRTSIRSTSRAEIGAACGRS